MTRFSPPGILDGLLSVLAHGRLATMMISMNRGANLSKMSRNPDLSRLCATDHLGGGATLPLGFLASYIRYRHSPAESMQTPVTLRHPSMDAWTLVELCMRVFRRLASPGKVVLFRACGHFLTWVFVHQTTEGSRSSPTCHGAIHFVESLDYEP